MSPRRTPPANGQRYQFDALDRVSGFNRSDSGPSLHFYCQQQLSTELRETQALSVLRSPTQLLAQRQAEAVCLLASDWHNTPLASLAASTLGNLAYTPYGHCARDHALLNGFNGEPTEPVSGLYLAGQGARLYISQSMRFSSPDSLSPFDEGGLNSYAFCLDDPVNHTDPSGHAPLFKLLKSIARLFRSKPASGFRIKGRAGPMLAPIPRARVQRPLPWRVPALSQTPSRPIVEPPKHPLDMVPRRIFGSDDMLTKRPPWANWLEPGPSNLIGGPKTVKQRVSFSDSLPGNTGPLPDIGAVRRT